MGPETLQETRQLGSPGLWLPAVQQGLAQPRGGPEQACLCAGESCSLHTLIGYNSRATQVSVKVSTSVTFSVFLELCDHQRSYF